ncbi:MAG: glycosyltransferase family 4 protein [Candidatus Altiarchaeota archaeon]|nr:glycosyltransferase family 4 protein [Candidatus Altiarchaeota archaeon]
MTFRVLLVSEYFPPKIFGGGELSAYTLAKELAGCGLSVSVLTSRFEGLKDFEERDGFRIYRLMDTGESPNSLLSNFKRKIVLPWSERRALKRLGKEFDAVHCLNSSSIVGCKTHALTVATLNGYSVFCPKGNLFYREKEVCTGCSFLKFIDCILHSEYMAKMRLKFYLKYNPLFWIVTYLDYLRRNRSLRNIRRFIVVNEFVKRFLVKKGVKKEDIFKIPNLLVFEKNNKDHSLPLEEGTVNITYIGTLDKIKGVDLLIKAFNNLGGEHLRLLIVGDGSERKKLEGMAGDRVCFLGKLDYELIPSIYDRSDVVVIPSRWPEPFSRVLLEATYHGKPVVATDVGGNPEGVLDGRNGFLVKPEVGDMERRLRQLLDDPNLRKRMGGEAKKLFRERFDAKKVVRKIIEAYQR